MKLITGILAALCLLACSSCGQESGLRYAEDLPETETQEIQYNRVYTDDEIPEDFNPDTDYLFLFLSDGRDHFFRVNPYSLRTSYLCMDPLCKCETYPPECPTYHMYPDLSKVIHYNGCLYYNGGQVGTVMGYDGSPDNYVEMQGNTGYALIRYDLASGEKKYLLPTEKRYHPRAEIWDPVLYGNDIYYYDYVKDESSEEEKEIYHLFRINTESGKNEDLGRYLGYMTLFVADDCIWNYYGFFYNPDSPLWEEEGDYFIVTDLNNENPVKVPEYRTPVDDVEGYIISKNQPYAMNGVYFLFYTGEQYERHVYRFPYDILRYEDGIIYHTKHNEMDKLFATDLASGEETVILDNLPVPAEAAQIRLYSLFKDKYAIFEVLAEARPGNSQGKRLYYMRVTLDTGEIQYIYRPEG